MFALLPLLLTLAPEVVRLIAGDKAGTATTAVTAAVRAVTGTDNPEAAAAALAADPSKAAELRVALAKIAADADQADRQASLDEMRASLADVADARKATVSLATSGSRMAWGAPILSGIILVSFAVMLCVVLTQAIPEGSAPLANVLLGTLSAMATQVANFWLGSSAGSAAKNETIANAQQALATSTPMSTEDLNARSLAQSR